jgi:hypothetical protein
VIAAGYNVVIDAVGAVWQPMMALSAHTNMNPVLYICRKDSGVAEVMVLCIDDCSFC